MCSLIRGSLRAESGLNRSYELKRNAWPKSWEFCFICWTCRGLKPRRKPPSSERLFQRGKVRGQDIQKFLQQKPCSWSIKISVLKKTRYLKLRNSALWDVREDERGQWNHCFDLHLSSLGPASHAFSSWVFPGAPSGVAAGGWLPDGHPVSIMSSLRTLCWGVCSVMAW